MDTLTFISNLAHYLAWPIVILILAMLFHSEIRSVICRISQVKVKDWVIKIAEEKALITEGNPPRTDLLENDELIAISPRAAIFESWQKIEQVLNTRFSNQIVRADSTKPLNPAEAIAFLSHKQQITASDAELLNNLRYWRNRAIHDPDEPSPETARGYCQLASTILIKLKDSA
jgi:hypothetical protein